MSPNSQDENRPEDSLVGDARHLLCGLLMGAADIIPGVSGGTVALVLGIYTRLVTAISHVDAALLRHVARLQWRSAAQHIDLRFLLALGVGIAGGMLALASLIHELLEGEFTRPLTLAAFFGMIAASALLVMRLIRYQSEFQALAYAALGAAGAALAYWLTTLDVVNAGVAPGYVYLFLCGAVAICAMILPGISGAHVLLILGVYTFVTGIIKDIPRGETSIESLGALAVFAAGCGVGLLGFSKVLRWLLARYHSSTMAVLCGFMIGALRKVWPFQTIELLGGGKEVFHPIWPPAWGGREWLAAAFALIAFAAVLATEWIARKQRGKGESANDK